MSFSRRATPAAAARGLSLVLLAVVTAAILASCGATSSNRIGGATDSSAPVSISGGVGRTSDDDYVDVSAQPLPAPRGAVSEVDGSRWSYRTAPSGKVTLLYFGYTSCPDVCPTTMADIAAAMSRVPNEVRDRVDVQFVSTDPRRDTAPQIGQWLRAFDPRFHGGRAPIASVIRAAAAYGIGIEPPKVTARDYQVTHGGQVLVLAEGGGAVGYFRELAGSRDYADLLPTLVRRYA